MHKVLYNLQDLIVDQVADVVNKGDLNKETLCNLDKAVDIYKDLQEIEHKEMEGASYGYMERRPMMRDDWGYAQANGGRMNRGYYEGNRQGSGTNRGYYENDEKQRMREHYERELRRATSEQERENIRQMIRELDGQM